ncbi:MAG: tripartite tricarboxylate transporter TctB family protein [Xanthobacteraceae bacterium]
MATGSDPTGSAPSGASASGMMRARIRNPRDLIAGLLFVAIGVATIAGASDYPIGTMRNIGPGYYPILLGVALVLLGGGVIVNAFRFEREGTVDDAGLALRPLVMVIAAMAAFGGLVRPFGLGAAIVALIVISSLGGRDISLVRMLLLSAAMTALAWAVFIWLLGLPMSMWPR